MPDDRGYYTSGEAAKYLGISQPTFNRRVANGEIKPVGDIVTYWKRFTKEELDRYRVEWLRKQEES